MTPTGQTHESPHHGSSFVGMVAPTAWLLVALLLGVSLGRVVEIVYWMPLTLALLLTVVAVVADRYARELNKARQNERRRETRRRWQAQTGQVPTKQQVQDHADKIDAEERRVTAESDASKSSAAKPSKKAAAAQSTGAAPPAPGTKTTGTQRVDPKAFQPEKAAKGQAGQDKQQSPLSPAKADPDAAGAKRAERRAAQSANAPVPAPKSAMGTASAPETTPLVDPHSGKSAMAETSSRAGKAAAVDQSPKASVGARVSPTANQPAVHIEQDSVVTTGAEQSKKSAAEERVTGAVGVTRAVPAAAAEIDYDQPWGPSTSASPKATGATKAVSTAVPSSRTPATTDTSKGVAASEAPRKQAQTPSREVTIAGESLSVGEHLIVGGYGFNGKRRQRDVRPSAAVKQLHVTVLRRSLTFTATADTRHPVMRNFAHPQETFVALPFVPRSATGSKAGMSSHQNVPLTGGTATVTNTAGVPVVRRRDRRAALKAKLDTGQLNVAELREDFSRLAVAIDTQANQIVPPPARKPAVDVTDKATGQVPHSNQR